LKIFLSWSGKQSHQLAKALKDWLPNLFPTVDPFLSSEDIDAGERWDRRLDDVLQEYNFGIVCVTNTNTAAPWLLFETGALAKKLHESRVVPVLCGISPTELTNNPLTKFQCVTLDQPGIFKLIRTINDALEHGKIATARLETSFNKWWSDLDKLIKELKPDKPIAKKSLDLDSAIEEILATVRSISRNIERPIAASNNQALIDALKGEPVAAPLIYSSKVALQRQHMQNRLALTREQYEELMKYYDDRGVQKNDEPKDT
jgi:hypothetical protein